MFELAREQEFVVRRYVARQSLLSAGRDALPHWPANFRLRSTFQNTMARDDWRGSVLDQLAEEAGRGLDLIVLDFTDERCGAYLFDDGTAVTRTIDMVGTPLEERARQQVFLAFGSDEHVNIWRRRLGEFAGELKRLGLFEKTVVFQVPWAEQTEEGEATPASMGLTAAAANELYRPYYRAVAAEGFRCIDLDSFPVFAEPLHRWGLAPFHYTLEVYDEMLGSLRRFVEVSGRSYG